MPPVEGVAGGGTGYGWNDGNVHSSSSLHGVVDPTKTPSSDLLHVWCMPNTANVSQQEMPRPLEPVSLSVLFLFYYWPFALFSLILRCK